MISRATFAGSLVATAAFAAVPPASAATRIVRSAVRALPVSDVVAIAPPFVSELASIGTTLWAALAYTSRVVALGDGLVPKTVTFADDGAAQDLVPMRDGSLFFRLAPARRATVFDHVGALDPSGTYRKIPYPSGHAVQRIARLGGDDLIATALGSSEFFVLRGDAFATFDAHYAAGAPPRAGDTPRNLVTASDGAVWYLRGADPARLGRVDSVGNVTELRLVRGGASVAASDLAPYRDGSVVVFVGDPARPSAQRTLVVASPLVDRIVLDDRRYAGTPVCAGTFDAIGRLWYLDYAGGALSAIALNPFQRLATLRVAVDPPVVCDGSVLAPYRDGIALANGAKIETFALAS